jgi:O-acetyl-ADP-ribose deacetylase (regulator of RNase III)
VKEVNGDLIEMAKKGEFDVIIHGCNCFNKMKAGVAKSISESFPEVTMADACTGVGDPRKLGTFSFIELGSELIILNAYTQFRYWHIAGESDLTPLVEYGAVRSVFKEVKKRYGGSDLRFGIPKIGAGLAGGNWDIIKDIIDSEMKGEDLTVVIFDTN